MVATYDDYIAHYGVKGMKWGVQRRSSDNTSSDDPSSGGGSRKQSNGENPSKKSIDKKKVALGVIGGVAAVGMGAMAVRSVQSGRKAAATSALQNIAKKSLTEMYLDTAPKQAPKSNYKPRAAKKDVKNLGEKASRRIEKKVNKGVPLKQARKQEVYRRGAGLAARYATSLLYKG